ncbi:hypothetical protein CLPUN_10300 [Clostridium puniceum]|uniref:Uncharacterized protein n=1 Tax=Clostridium puniceum TaxID=29367 RepID=A0A1S8TVB6_9CLOT|nr:hypothetical protein [Clostridium puniceum]OOM81641.1 hypothetical protein CLPUN_10300 [Clostridium puniceum]
MSDIQSDVRRAPLSSLISELARIEFQMGELNYSKQEIMRELIKREMAGKIKGTKLEK